MKLSHIFATAAAAAVLAGASSAGAAAYSSYTSLLGGTVINFENLADSTLVDTQYAGVTFSQTPSGRPRIDQYPWLFGYGASSGDHVLTGSTEGGNTFDTTAGLIATFSSGKNGVEVFLSDTAPLGNYPITFFGAGGSVLGTLTIDGGDILPPGYNGGVFPNPGTFPLPGIFVGFTTAGNDIFGIKVGGSTAANDSFAIDDLRYTSKTGGGIPEPATWAMMILGFGVAGTMVRRRRELTA